MRVSGLYSADLQNGPGVGVTLGTAGCNKRCEGCFNSQFWDLNSGSEYSYKIHDQILDLVSKDYIDHFSVIGGEPLIKENLKQLYHLIKDIKEKRPDIKVWIWSGYTFEEIISGKNILPCSLDTFNSFAYWQQGILNNTDYIVDGPFIQELADPNLLWRGSSNQRIIDVQEAVKDMYNFNHIEGLNL